LSHAVSACAGRAAGVRRTAARVLLAGLGLICSGCAGDDSLASSNRAAAAGAGAAAEENTSTAGRGGVQRPGGAGNAGGAAGRRSVDRGATGSPGAGQGGAAGGRNDGDSSAAGAGEAGGPGEPDGGSAGTRRAVGYFVAWGVYGRNYHVKNIADSGAAETLTHINYAFANVTNGACAIGDAYAEYDRFYDAATSVDGQPDTWDAGALRGSFHQLQKLKAMYPGLRLLISLGGWTWSAGFSAAAAPAQREAFVRSCIELFITDARWPGLFDGIDVDWEYPARCGNTCSDNPEDTANFTALLAEFRRQLDAVRPGLELTIAAPAAADKVDAIEVDRIHPHLDAINLMSYDLHGAWEQRTNFHAALHPAAADPDRTLGFTTDEAVQLWLDRGTPAQKLVVGLPFYGRGWAGVAPSEDGLYQTATMAAPATYEAGIEDYDVLAQLGADFAPFRHDEAQAFWVYSASAGVFWTYDDPMSIANKTRYARERGLAGVMFWELSGDDAAGSLVRAIAGAL
jgi:chitinase